MPVMTREEAVERLEKSVHPGPNTIPPRPGYSLDDFLCDMDDMGEAHGGMSGVGELAMSREEAVYWFFRADPGMSYTDLWAAVQAGQSDLQSDYWKSNSPALVLGIDYDRWVRG